MFGPSRRVARRTARRTSRRQMAMNDQMSGGYDDQPEPQSAPTAPAEPDYAAELQKLASLRDQGIISNEDYEAKKKQVLGI